MGSASVLYFSRDIPAQKVKEEQSTLRNYYSRAETERILALRFPPPEEETSIEENIGKDEAVEEAPAEGDNLIEENIVEDAEQTEEINKEIVPEEKPQDSESIENGDDGKSAETAPEEPKSDTSEDTKTPPDNNEQPQKEDSP